MSVFLRNFFLIFFVCSCVFIRIDDSVDLGHGYRYIQDAPQVIIYNTSPKSKATGKIIIPPVVKSYAFNDRYIIAKSQGVDENTGNSEGKPIYYWIIDKAKKGYSVPPLDSVAFYKVLKIKDIHLGF